MSLTNEPIIEEPEDDEVVHGASKSSEMVVRRQKPKVERLSWHEGVEFYSDPSENDKLFPLFREYVALPMTFEEKQMIFWTIETLTMAAYTMYDHLFFHTCERIVDSGIIHAFDSYGSDEAACLEGMKPLIDLAIGRCEEFIARKEFTEEGSVTDVFKNTLNKLKANVIEIMSIWKAFTALELPTSRGTTVTSTVYMLGFPNNPYMPN